MHLPITLTMAAAVTLIHFWIAVRCSRIRIGAKIPMGDGGHSLMQSRMRAHSNFSENAPLFLILLALIEWTSGTSPWLWAVGIIFVLARIAHVIGMDRPAPNPYRMGGISLNFLILIGMAGYAIFLSYGQVPHA